MKLGIKNRKSVFYSFVAIILLLFMVYAVSIKVETTMNDEMDYIRMRAHAMNNFMKALADDMERGIYISGFRSIASLEQYTLNRGSFVNDSEAVLMECFLNGSINSTKQPLMNESTFYNWSTRMKEEAAQLGFALDIAINDIEVYMSDSWNLVFGVNASINLSDTISIASWSTHKYVEATIEITDFEDPFYFVNTAGRVTAVISRSPYTGNFTDGSDTTNLKSHINSPYYIASLSGPDFLMRFEGNISNSSNGIESLVDLNKFIALELPVEVESAVDYIYFRGEPSGLQLFKVNNTYESWFRLDNTSSHLKTYMVEKLAVP